MTESPTVQLTNDQVTHLRDNAKRSFYFFAKAVLGFSKLNARIHKPLCDLLQDQTNRRLKITLPRSWYKTTICSIAYPIWRAVLNPNVRILIVQNTYSNACAKLRSIDGVFSSCPLFRALFTDVLPDKSCVWRTDSLCVKRTSVFPESTFEAAGIRTQVTSRHYDLIIEDDTVAPDLSDLTDVNVVPTKEDIVQAIGWHRLGEPLLVDSLESQRIVVGTRWFELDLLSWIDQNEGTVYNSYERAVRETNGRPDPKGDYVYPERFNDEVMRQLECSMGPYLVSCLYYNTPVASASQVFKPDWIRLYDIEPGRLVVFTSVDPGTDAENVKSSDPDSWAIVTTGKDMKTGLVYVLETTDFVGNPGQAIGEIFGHVRRWNPIKVLVESVAFQNTLSYWIRERMRAENLYFVVDTITTGGRAKDARIMGLQPLFANGVIMMRHSHTKLRSELLAFPLGVHDDLLDALAMHLGVWQVTSQQRERELARRMADDPFSLAGAVESFRRNQAQTQVLVYDVFKQPVSVN